MCKQHKHHDLIVAWAKGAFIQREDECGEWRTVDPTWRDDVNYRIKPESKPDFYRWYPVNSDKHPFCTGGYHIFVGLVTIAPPDEKFSGIKLTFDGETGKLKKAEVIA